MPPSQAALTDVRPRRRNGRLQACEPCRTRKVACDHQQPVCTRCRRSRKQDKCVYIVAKSSPVPTDDGQPWSAPSPPAASSTYTSPRNDSTGYLGATSYSEVFKETQTGLQSKVSSPMMPNNPRLEPAGSRKLLSDQNIAVAIEILRNVPDRATSEGLFSSSMSFTSTWVDPAAKDLQDTLWSVFGSTLESKSEPSLADMVRVISHNTSLPINEDESDPKAWLASFSGPRFRWECLGILFAAWACGAEFATGTRANQSRFSRCSFRKLLIKYKAISEQCINLATELGTTTSLLQHLLCRQSVMESFVTGETSLQHWKTHMDAMGFATFIGLHVSAGDPRDRSISIQARRRICAKIITADKLVSSFTGRPPLVAQRFVSTPLPLDLSDEVLLGVVPWNDNMIDENGWNTSGKVYPVTLLRARTLIAAVRDSILENALRPVEAQPDDDGKRVTLLDLQQRQMKIMEGLPDCIIFKEQDITDTEIETNTLCSRLLVQLEHMQNMFLIQRMLERHAAQPTSELLETSSKLVSQTLLFWTHRDRMGGLHGDFEWLVMGYAAPASGVLCLALLRGSNDTCTIPRSTIIQQLSNLVAFFNWVHPQAPNANVCHEVQGFISHVLDQTLNVPSQPQGFDAALLGDYQKDMSGLFNFELFDTFDWLPSSTLHLG